MNDDLAALAQFNGTGRLFPLPNIVLFPSVMQPLHIFEPRYRQMTADALAGDRLITLALLRPGYEKDYEGRPPLYSMACLGRIVADQALADGRYNILLRGLKRARIGSELETGKLYRTARLELLADTGLVGTGRAQELRLALQEQVLPWFPAQGSAGQQLRELLESDVPLGVLCDILSFALPFPIEAKQELLQELAVERRAQALIRLMQTTEPPRPPSGDRKFPPEFSSN